MARQIIKQQNGKYCVFSSIVDDIIIYNATPKELVEEFSERIKRQTEKEVQDIIKQIDENQKPYYQFTMSFDEMINRIEEVHGLERANEVKKIINNQP